MDDSLIVEICVGVCGFAIAVIVIAPWRAVRREKRMNDEVQSRLLLGENPDAIGADEDAAEARELAQRPDPPVELPRRSSAC